MSCTQKLAGLLVVGLLLITAARAQDDLYNSASTGSTGVTSGFVVASDVFLGSRFTVPDGPGWDVGSVGMHMSDRLQDDGNNMIFYAVIELEAGTVPMDPNFDNVIVRGTAIGVPPRPSDDFHLPMPIHLEPGDYALVAGSGLFGATGLANAPTASQTGAVEDQGVGSYFFRSDSTGGWRNGGFTGVHFGITAASAPNQSPTAVAGVDQSIHAGEAVVLDGSASFDDNTASESLTYAWTMTASPTGSAAVLTGADSATPSFVADLPGSYELSLVVTDEDGLSSTADTVTISSENLAPTADAGADFGAIVDDLVILDGSASSDPDNDSLAFFWSITATPAGSQASLDDATAVSPAFVADLPGSYTVQLTVSDGFENSSPDDVVISVITAQDSAEIDTMAALNCVSALPPTDVSTPGNQEALGNFMTQVIEALQADDIEEAINKLNKASIRTDGCALRGEPDGNGSGRDWITDCEQQAIVYQLIQDALSALSP